MIASKQILGFLVASTTLCSLGLLFSPGRCPYKEHEEARRLQEPPTPIDEIFACPGETTITECMGLADYDAVGDTIDQYLEPQSAEEKKNFCACTLRLAGHDFMDRRDYAGGSDGCINMADLANGGLINCMTPLAALFGQTSPVTNQSYCSTISRPDFIIIAAEKCVSLMLPEGKSIDFRGRFRYGRTTNTECENGVVAALPNPMLGCPINEETFQAPGSSELSWTQIAALMGVHTLGAAHLMVSGFEGKWSDDANQMIFNNDYYKALITNAWTPFTENPFGITHFWKRFDRGGVDTEQIMLDTDICLAYNKAGTDTPLLAPDADPGCCARSSSKALDGGRFAAVLEHRKGNYTNGDHCGSVQRLSSKQQRRQCCAESGPDCNDEKRPDGPAIGAVMAFAADEDLWFQYFMDVWVKVTTAGHEGKLFCPDADRTCGSVGNCGQSVPLPPLQDNPPRDDKPKPPRDDKPKPPRDDKPPRDRNPLPPRERNPLPPRDRNPQPPRDNNPPPPRDNNPPPPRDGDLRSSRAFEIVVNSESPSHDGGNSRSGRGRGLDNSIEDVLV